MFWDSHAPTRAAWSRQYMSAVFYHDEEQKRFALATRDREAGRVGREIHTEILPAEEFTLAEDYHQKYRLRADPTLMMEFRSMYPGESDFVNSTAAAHVNGYLAGYGTFAALRAELGSLGLSPEAQNKLLALGKSLRR